MWVGVAVMKCDMRVGHESLIAGSSSNPSGPPGRMGYQGTRRAALRGRGGVPGFSCGGRGRYSQFPSAVPYNYMEFGMKFFLWLALI